MNPLKHLLAPSGVLTSLPGTERLTITGKEFFPHLIAGPFHSGLVIVFAVAAGLSVLAGLASLLRGGRYVPDAAAGEVSISVDTAMPG